jgi:hypothetical protein
MNSPAPWINEAILTWQKEGIKLRPGALETYIAEMEQWLGFSFPADFYEFYKVVNGFERWSSNENFFSLWSLETLWEEGPNNQEDDFIGFCDHMINSHWIGFVKNKPGIYRHYPNIITEGRTTKIADSFKEFIELLNTDSELLY